MVAFGWMYGPRSYRPLGIFLAATEANVMVGDGIGFGVILCE